MPRTRQALRCKARRHNGESCGNYAMIGGRVCHAHGGRAPQVRAAARRRSIQAYAWRRLARFQAEDRARRAAIEPWAPEVRVEMFVGQLVPDRSAKHLRAIARGMEANAQALRAYARELLAHSED